MKIEIVEVSDCTEDDIRAIKDYKLLHLLASCD